MKLTADEIRVIWLAMHSFQPYDPELACGLTEDQQVQICREIRDKIFCEICDSLDNPN